MSNITDLQERLALYKAAEKAILEGSQEYRIGLRRVTRADLNMVQDMIKDISTELAVAQNNGRFSHNITVFGGRR